MNQLLTSLPLHINDGTIKTFNDYKKEKGYVIFFYPKALTPGCTLEAVKYSEYYQTFVDLGYQLIGISRDKVKKQNDFSCKYDIPFPLVSDTDSALCNHFKVLKNKKMFNNTFLAISRSTFIVNNDLEIIKEFLNVKPTEHIKAVLEYIKDKK
ncbi:peroxiredoxin [Spiroplasma endosymbiont of Nebria brevicollis]|uniref:peroxiredoxin n=1 Tax=Spiroplasma endosymbiont of Nebria brevicollis TaxID=3066284 RepID=UPI00313AD1A7